MSRSLFRILCHFLFLTQTKKQPSKHSSDPLAITYHISCAPIPHPVQRDRLSPDRERYLSRGVVFNCENQK